MSAPWYCSREDVKNTLDMQETARRNLIVDREIEAACDSIDSLLRFPIGAFLPTTATKYFAWPTLDSGGSWKLWLDGNQLVSLTALVGGGSSISLSNVYLEPNEYGPPYNRIELRRDTNASFSGGSTPQRQIGVTAEWCAAPVVTDSVTTLNGSISSTVTTIAVHSGARIGVGDMLLIGTERLAVTERAFADTTVNSSGSLSSSNASVTLAVPDGTAFEVGESILIDAEVMRIDQILTNNLIVKRAFDGSVLAAHTSNADIYASRTLTVTRGVRGSTAATHADAATVSVYRAPALVRQLATAEAVSTLLQGQAGWARNIQAHDGSAREVLGRGLKDLRARVSTAYGRSPRMGAV